MNTDNFLIEENDLEIAHGICKIIESNERRNRAVANVVGANIASKYFDAAQYDVDSSSGLHNIGQVLEDIDISDIYINNSYIDVRLFFEDDGLFIPKEHFEKNLLPLAYMFIKITPDLSGANVVGFIQPENVDKTAVNGDFYIIQEESLVSFYDIESYLVAEDDPYDVSEKEVFAYLDNSLEDKVSFYRKLLISKDGRLRLARAAKAQYIFSFVSAPNADNVNTYAAVDDADSLAFNAERELVMDT